MTDISLEYHLKKAAAAFDRLPPEEKEKQLEDQRRSWVVGEMMLSRPEMPREKAEALYKGSRGTLGSGVLVAASPDGGQCYSDLHALPLFRIGDRIKKITGEYSFEGVVVSLWLKRDLTTIRYVVEDDRGVCLIMSAKQLCKL